jgi:hypothetical protein
MADSPTPPSYICSECLSPEMKASTTCNMERDYCLLQDIPLKIMFNGDLEPLVNSLPLFPMLCAALSYYSDVSGLGTMLSYIFCTGTMAMSVLVYCKRVAAHPDVGISFAEVILGAAIVARKMLHDTHLSNAQVTQMINRADPWMITSWFGCEDISLKHVNFCESSVLILLDFNCWVEMTELNIAAKEISQFGLPQK